MDFMGAKFDQLFETDDFSIQKKTDTYIEKEMEEEVLYNATDDIVDLFVHGPKEGIFNIVLMTSFIPVKEMRFIQLDKFGHKIGFKMDDESAYAYFGKRNLTKDSLPEQAVYYDGGNMIRTFLPYPLPWQEENNML